MNNVYCKLECVPVTDGGGADAPLCENLRQKTSLEHIESVHKSHPPSDPESVRCLMCVDPGSDAAVMTSPPHVGLNDRTLGPPTQAYVSRPLTLKAEARSPVC
ncbi:Hypothetical predicted protein [Xyrichtys novacula]|uniref:Uncharacterized protein n=1 Tax=Xyrichtys novacula TaxID=13765 RepID=A0AAV1GMB7_XYRNO|nr:Hypothetical predicted protein [Xyrichtys novacula]